MICEVKLVNQYSTKRRPFWVTIIRASKTVTDLCNKLYFWYHELRKQLIKINAAAYLRRITMKIKMGRVLSLIHSFISFYSSVSPFFLSFFHFIFSSFLNSYCLPSYFFSLFHISIKKKLSGSSLCLHSSLPQNHYELHLHLIFTLNSVLALITLCQISLRIVNITNKPYYLSKYQSPLRRGYAQFVYLFKVLLI